MKNEPKEKSRSKWRGFSLKALFVLVTCSSLFFAWRQYEYERGTINDWVDSVLAQAEDQSVSCPLDILEDEQLGLLMKATRWEKDPNRQQCLLKIIVEQFPERARECCGRILSETKDSLFRRNAILVMGLYRDEADIAFVRNLISSKDPIVRCAAVDAIAIIHCPSYPMPAGFEDYGDSYLITGDVAISLGGVHAISDPKRNQTWETGWEDTPDNIPMPADLVTQITLLMLDDEDQQVREAAARALRIRPKYGYRMRVAEWGVWINEGADLTLAQSIIDEIPPFVHRSGNSLASIEQGRRKMPMIVTKPIVHMTVDRPMSVDLTVKITAGRPWFGYPMPDDFSVSGVPFRFGFVKRSKIDRSARDVPDELSIQDLTQIRSGYPWLGPSHPKEYMSAVTNVGFRWQSLIVLPERADWMKLEPVSKPKYQWWNRLREVQSSWICNRGESERFLYYDGPTESRSPVRVLDERIRIEIQAPPNNLEQACEREILYIEVRDEAVSAACKTMDVSAQSTSFTFLDTSNRPISGEDVASKLTKILVAKGLNHEEADGLVDCWRPQFFETGGRRLLTIFGTEEYGQLCPLSVSPKPTELARVGIVLTELKPKRENVKEIGREHKKRAEKNLRSESQLVH